MDEAHHRFNSSALLNEIVRSAGIRPPDNTLMHAHDEVDLMWHEVVSLGGETLTLFFDHGHVQIEARAPWGPPGSALIIQCLSITEGSDFIILQLKALLGAEIDESAHGLFPSEGASSSFLSQPAITKLPRPPQTYVFRASDLPQGFPHPGARGDNKTK